MLKSFCMLLICLLLAGHSQAQDILRNRYNPVDLQLVGPLETVTIRSGNAGETRIEIALLKGEKRRIQVPLAISASLVDPETDVTWHGDGAVIWPTIREFEAAKPLSRSSMPLPAVPNPVPLLPPASALGLVALALLLFLLRRRLGLCSGVALLGSLLLFAQLGIDDPAGASRVRIIEIGVQGPWRVLDSARDSMGHVPGQSIRLEVKPASQSVIWHVTEEHGDWVMEARAKGAMLRKEFRMQPGARGLNAELNALGNLEQVWVREDSGFWSARGAWPMGAGLPKTVSGLQGPPSWLVSALPQGPEMWVARFAAGAGPRIGGSEPSETWLRVRLAD